MAAETKINDIASQLSTASRLVVSTDFFWIYMANGSQVKIPAEFVRAYLSEGLKPTIGSDGNWVIGGESTGVKAEGVAPKLRGGNEGIEVSYDNGSTWSMLALYTSMGPVISDLIEAYENIVNSEQDRVTAENGRVTAENSRVKAETSRVDAEKARVAAETQRESDFATSKAAADKATEDANGVAQHPPYVDADGYFYRWDTTTKAYSKTDVNLTGKAFQIKKVFASVSAMNATDVNTFAENDFILINTADVEDEDNAKLYVVAINQQGRKFYSYLVDMSGFRGFMGKTPQFLIGNVTTLAEDAEATATVSASGTDTDGNPVYKLNLGIPKGIRLRFADLTDSDKAELMKPAIDAAAESKTQTAACKTATDNANAATENANIATKNANNAADKANNSAANADTKAKSAEAAAKNANEAADRVDTSITDITEQKQAAIDAADNANDTANHPTYIGGDNYVYAWDKGSKSYIKSNIYVKGEQGIQGEQGLQGLQGVKGDKGENGKSPYVQNGNWWVYDDAQGKFINSGVSVSSAYQLTKEKVEDVLTGDITSHTHSKYALGTSLTDEVQRATAKEASLQAIIDIINGASTVEGSYRKAIADLIGGAPESLDTLKEIADKLSKDDDLHKLIEEAIAQKADKSTTLGGYGITDTYTKEEVATILAAYLTSEVARKTYQPIGNYLTSHQSLTGYATETWVKGLKYITDDDAAAKYQPKGNYLTSHQSLAEYIKTVDADKKYLGKTEKAASASTADNAAKVNNHIVNANVPANAKFTDTEYVIPTLSSAPTSSTLTFTDNGATRSFKVGYMCRVADSSAEHGYKFYQLYNISGNNAVWGEIAGGGVELNEVVSISLISNQSNSDTALNGATITVTNIDTGKIISTQQWKGTVIKLKIASVTSVSVSVSSVKGYRSPNAKTFLTGVGSTRNVTMQYDTEVVTITVTANNGANVSGQIVVVNNENHTYSSPYSVKIPFGTHYSVSVNGKNGYIAPAAVSYTANQKSRSVTLSYTYSPMGIYILDTDGNLTTANKWDTANNSKAVGVYVGTENSKFVIAPASSAAKEWGGSGTTISGIVTSEYLDTPPKDYAGESNTDKIIAQLGTGNAPAAEYCRNYTFKNGKKGYLWAFGELQDAHANIEAIDAAISKIGGTYIGRAVYWTSTQASSTNAWRCSLYNYTQNQYSKGTLNAVRPVCSI